MLEIKFSFSSLEILTRSGLRIVALTPFFCGNLFYIVPSNTKNNFSLHLMRPRKVIILQFLFLDLVSFFGRIYIQGDAVGAFSCDGWGV